MERLFAMLQGAPAHRKAICRHHPVVIGAIDIDPTSGLNGRTHFSGVHCDLKCIHSPKTPMLPPPQI